VLNFIFLKTLERLNNIKIEFLYYRNLPMDKKFKSYTSSFLEIYDQNVYAEEKIIKFLDHSVIPAIRGKLFHYLKNFLYNINILNNDVCGLVAKYIPLRLGYDEIGPYFLDRLVYRINVYKDITNSSLMNSLLLSFSMKHPIYESIVVVCGEFKKVLVSNDKDNTDDIVDIILSLKGDLKQDIKRLKE